MKTKAIGKLKVQKFEMSLDLHLQVCLPVESYSLTETEAAVSFMRSVSNMSSDSEYGEGTELQRKVSFRATSHLSAHKQRPRSALDKPDQVNKNITMRGSLRCLLYDHNIKPPAKLPFPKLSHGQKNEYLVLLTRLPCFNLLHEIWSITPSTQMRT